MDIPRIIYLSFLSISLALAIYARRRQNELNIFTYILGLSLFTEITTQILVASKLNGNIVYHIFIPLEYALWAGYFSLIARPGKTKKLVLGSIPLFILCSVLLSTLAVPVTKFPSLQLNLEGIFLIIWSVVSIFHITVLNDRSIFSLPVFWICTGVLIYYTGISSFMGVYNFISLKHSQLLSFLQVYLLIIPNYILYTCLSIAFVCSRRIKK